MSIYYAQACKMRVNDPWLFVVVNKGRGVSQKMYILITFFLRNVFFYQYYISYFYRIICAMFMVNLCTCSVLELNVSFLSKRNLIVLGYCKLSDRFFFILTAKRPSAYHFKQYAILMCWWCWESKRCEGQQFCTLKDI